MKKAEGRLGLVTVRVMQKHKRDTNRQWLALLVCTVVLVLGSIFPFKALAAACEVGDLSKGYWGRVNGPDQGKCVIPGPPAADSLWPVVGQISSVNYPAYRIEGKYKLTAYMDNDRWSHSIHPAQPECITGYAEAYTAVVLDYYLRQYRPMGTYTATGTLITCTYYNNDPANTEPEHKEYLRSFEYNFRLEEWVWTNKDCANEPPPAPTNTPNLDPGKPDCPQAPLN